MQPYDSPRDRNPYLNHSRIPGMRVAQTISPSISATPIYDALYTEYQRLFRALPGDRSDEEQLRFEGFGASYPRANAATERWGGYWEATARRQRPALPPAPRDGRHPM